jgi:tryptophan 2,3-dioxygenase
MTMGVPPINYAAYLEIERLLALQRPRSSPEEHDELLFIVIHQVYELWFKVLLHELDKLGRDFDVDDLWGAVHTMKRSRTILKTLVGQLDILETMTPLSFAAFRDRLDTASGFQSLQFRELEFLLGYKRREVLRYVDPSWPGVEKVRRRLEEPSLVDRFIGFLGRRGMRIPARRAVAEVSAAPTRPDRAIQRGLLELYRGSPESAILFELMMDFDEGLQEWRYRHVKIVERTIGRKRGTGGSPGVAFLKKSLFRPVFPDLWAIRAEM